VGDGARPPSQGARTGDGGREVLAQRARPSRFARNATRYAGVYLKPAPARKGAKRTTVELTAR
jgi:hypothetical protein